MEKPVLVGVIPEAIVLGPRDQVAWYTEAGTLKIEFDTNRCPFTSNVYQAPAGIRVLSGTPRPGAKPGSYKYRIAIGEVVIARGEVILTES